MDRTAWIVVIFCGFGLFWWFGQQAKYVEEADNARRQRAAEAVIPATQEEEEVPGKDATEQPPRETIEESTLSNDQADWVFTTGGGGIARVRLKDHNLKYRAGDSELAEDEEPKVTLNIHSTHPIGELTTGVGKFKDLVYGIVSTEDRQIVLQAQDGELQITKTFKLANSGDVASTETGAEAQTHLVQLELRMKHTGNSRPYEISDYYLYTGSAAPLFPKEWEAQTGFSYFFEGDDEFQDVNHFEDEDLAYTEACEEFIWGSVENQFYAINICAEKEYNGGIWATRRPVKLTGYEEASGQYYAVEGAIRLPAYSLNPGQEQVFKYDIYTGPKHYKLLKSLDRERVEMTGFGRMPIFGWMAKPFSKPLSSLMDYLYGLFGNYGWAIICITLIIRFAIWPLHIKSQRTMKRMSLLQPKMKELKEKYQDNPQKMNQETMALYRDYGVNPLGGCLPILLQMPIFLGFFAMLRSAVELRHQPWLGWVEDLSMPDTVVHIAGFPLNILPILMGITMVLQMRMTPSTGDKMQRRIFMLMPVIFLIFCYGFASALALYWTAQNIISIGQTWLLRNRKDVELVKRKRVPRPMPGKGRPSFNAPAKKKPPKRKQIRTGGSKGRRS
ncbi:MAG: membrane protein insertase YidC [Verrucomicrobiaceae bacterium]|nr:membrane protein insertase YidC [Verrucomicrobiaceae bacterium]